MKRSTIIMVALVMSLGFLISCSGDKEKASEQKGDKQTEVAILLNGTRGDKAFFDSAAHGGEMLEKEGIKTKVVEMTYDETKWTPTLEDYSDDSNYGTIIVGTWQMTERLEKIAKEHPEKKYIIFDSAIDYEKNPDIKNVYSIEYKQNECSYLAGAVAALKTKTGKIGFVAGMENYVINDFLLGYIQGAKEVNPEIKIAIGYIGNFNDSAKAKELTLAQINQGADVVYQVASTAGLGVIDACAEKEVWAIGVDADQEAQFKEKDPEKAKHILTSALKNVDESIYQSITADKEGKLTYGQVVKLGLAEKTVGIVKEGNYQSNLEDQEKEKITELENKILNGEIQVDTAFGKTMDEINAIKSTVK